MTPSNAILLAFLAAMTTAAWAGLFLYVPRCVRSMYRHKLWALRDAMMDDLIYDRIRDHKAVRDQIALTEVFIHFAEHLSLWYALWTPKPPKEALKEIELAWSNAQSTLEPSDRQRLAEYRQMFSSHLRWYLLASTPPGWCFWCFLQVRRAIRSVKHNNQNDNDDRVNHIVKKAYNAALEHRNRGNLEACVG